MTGPRMTRGPLLGWREGRDAAERMQQRRHSAGLSREQLAELLGQTAAWVAMREQGTMRLSVAEVEQVAAALGTDPAELTRKAS